MPNSIKSLHDYFLSRIFEKETENRFLKLIICQTNALTFELSDLFLEKETGIKKVYILERIVFVMRWFFFHLYSCVLSLILFNHFYHSLNYFCKKHFN